MKLYALALALLLGGCQETKVDKRSMTCTPVYEGFHCVLTDSKGEFAASRYYLNQGDDRDFLPGAHRDLDWPSYIPRVPMVSHAPCTTGEILVSAPDGSFVCQPQASSHNHKVKLPDAREPK